ncbi:MAG: DMT family transporter [Candidatus Adiutrix sp.]|jgi:drug/metabolite transporter (DMT)-like permease|nr:DMT family transporter [Candidatus Adiutrix sp.]
MNFSWGELAALATAVVWAVSAQVQGAVGRLVGPTGVTLLRMPYQIGFLAVMCLLMPISLELSWEAFIYIALSGVLGIFLSDFMLYRAIDVIGPSTAVLILSSSTVFSAGLGWLFLGEAMGWRVLAGIGLTLAGILWVVTERSGSTLLPGQEIPKGRTLRRGVLAAAAAALALAFSFICLKAGLRSGADPLWAAFLRVMGGAVVLWLTGAVRGWVTAVRRNLALYPKVYWMLFGSCACGAAGLWLSSVAMAKAPVAVAATLIGLQPVVIALISAGWYHRRLSLRVVSGIVAAFMGTALICL